MSNIVYANTARPTVDLNQSFGVSMRYRTISPVGELKPTEGERIGDWDFPVAQETLRTSAGIKTPIMAVIRQDNGEFVGSYRSEALTSNVEIHEAVLEALSRQGIDDPQMTAEVYGNGSRTVMTYNLRGSSFGGESFSNSLRVKNSYDGSWQISASSMATRLACLNGMYLNQQETIVSKRHSAGVDPAALAKVIGSNLQGLDHDLAGLERLQDLPISHDHAMNVLGNVARLSKGALGLKGATRIALNWIEPSEDEVHMGDSWWRLFNAGTRYFRDLAEVQRGLSHKGNKFFSDALLLAVHPERSGFATHAKAELTAVPPANWDLHHRD